MEANEAFVIDTPAKANWAIKKIKDARRIRDVYIETANAEIEGYKQKIVEAESRCERETEYLTEALAAFMASGDIPTRTSKTQTVALLPDGKLKLKLAKLDFEKDDADLLLYLQENAKEFIKTEQKPMWGEFKKLLEAKGDIVVRADTGEIVQGVSVKETPEKFEVE